MSDVFDFDAAFAEKDGPTMPVRVMGREWQIPRDAPAEVLLTIQRLQMELPAILEKVLAGELSEDSVIDERNSVEGMVRHMVGDATLDKWLELGIGYKQLQRVMGRLYAYYSGQITDLNQDPEQLAARNRAAGRAAMRTAKKAATATARKSTSSRKSSTGGRSSKRTSTANTRST